MYAVKILLKFNQIQIIFIQKYKKKHSIIEFNFVYKYHHYSQAELYYYYAVTRTASY